MNTINSPAGVVVRIDTHRRWPRCAGPCHTSDEPCGCAASRTKLLEQELDAHVAEMREPTPGAAGHASSELLADDWDGAELRARLQVDDMLAEATKWLFRVAVLVLVGGTLYARLAA